MTVMASTLARRRGRFMLALPVLMLLLCVLAVVHLGVGARTISPQTVVQALFHFDAKNFDHRIIVSLRLLRMAAAMLVGAALGVAGVLLQALIRNPLGEPHILGLNAGAAFVVVLCAALGVTGASQPLLAAGGAAALFSLVMALSSAGHGGITPLKVTLCGVALSAMVSSLTAAILILDEQTLLAMRTWLVGDLAGLSWESVKSAVPPSLAGMVLALVIAPGLNILALGDRMACGLGVNILRIRLLAMIAIALLCGAAVSVVGPLGFIGLLVPNVTRRLVTEDIRQMLPTSALLGAALLLLADIAARTVLAPQELATGIMTALVGAPAFIFIASRFLK
ncbi:FecCD family ABC transporter permease [Citrobacter sp. U14242]|uniref:FecCD family ABC transporter permease n=1 Tax=Citrobacter sp. U14242 TaxID=3390192 RepID=UPI00397E13A1